jgi:hypothetical protein
MIKRNLAALVLASAVLGFSFNVGKGSNILPYGNGRGNVEYMFKLPRYGFVNGFVNAFEEDFNYNTARLAPYRINKKGELVDIDVCFQ